MGIAVAAKPFETKLNTAVLKKAYCELGEDEERRQQVIEIIRQWMAQQPHLQRIRLGINNTPFLKLLLYV
jgi:DNA polymerase III delta subunit